MLHLSNLSIFVDHLEVASWIKSWNKKIRITSGFRWTIPEDLGISTGECSVQVEAPSNYQFCAYKWFQGKSMKNPVKVRIWHYGMQKACRKCMIFGHMAEECNVTLIAPLKGSYAAAVNKPKTMVVLAPSSMAAPPPPMTLTIPSSADVLPLYTKSGFQSNHFPCKFKYEKGTDYNCTEQFLFFKKAVQAGDLSRAKEIMQAKEVKQAKWIGEKVSWDEKKLGTWTKFACNQLFKTNMLKYEQNKDLREALFKTSPAILVEASPYDKNWGGEPVNVRGGSAPLMSGLVAHNKTRLGVVEESTGTAKSAAVTENLNATVTVVMTPPPLPAYRNDSVFRPEFTKAVAEASMAAKLEIRRLSTTWVEEMEQKRETARRSQNSENTSDDDDDSEDESSEDDQLPRTTGQGRFAWFQTKGMQNAVKAKIWHYNMTYWCRKCMASGHVAQNCTRRVAEPSKGSYAAAVKVNPGTKLVAHTVPSTNLSNGAGSQAPAPKEPDQGNQNIPMAVIPLETENMAALDLEDDPAHNDNETLKDQE
uniref:CCHC-type domain-containing protein n=1 Tax=Romanomermis culicivorax TaxID=13658 RepID=A0A915JCX6_ROMCU